MQIWIGTSGYSYPDWVGSFYPPRTSPGRMLALYCRSFPLVELNFTFYRLPTPSMLARLAEQTPAGFQFIVKLPRTLSHEESERELDSFRQAIEELNRRQRLLGLLCQLPQASRNTLEHRSWICKLAENLAGYRLAVEFRHRSWFEEEVPPWLAENQLDLVAVDVPDIPGLYPRGLVRSGPRVYVRFHSRQARKWYQSDKQRYDFDFSEAALREWTDALGGIGASVDKVLLLFNNCYRGQAAKNAEQMRVLVERLLPDEEIVRPFAPASMEMEQRLLFD